MLMHTNNRTTTTRLGLLGALLCLAPGCTAGDSELDGGETGQAGEDDGTGPDDPASDGSGPSSTSGAGDSGDEPSGGSSGSDSSGAGSSTGGMPVRDTFYVEGHRLYDTCGEEVVLRGVNHPTIFVDRQGAAMPEIAKTGANAVRIFWFAEKGVPLSDAEDAVNAAVDNGMVPMIEMHDSTCTWKLEGIVDYWTRPESVAFIEKHQEHLLVNIANEASPPSGEVFRNTYEDIVGQMREAGIHTPIVIDAGQCGRDYPVLFDHGPALLEADPDHNLIFSAHLYDPMDAQGLASVFQTSIDLELPFIVGELANKSPPGCGASLNYGPMIEEAEELGIGWLAWSWGDNDPDTWWNGDCWEFDMTRTFSFSSLERWGKEVAIDHPASIRNTSVRPQSLLTGTCR